MVVQGSVRFVATGWNSEREIARVEGRWRSSMVRRMGHGCRIVRLCVALMVGVVVGGSLQ